jgi:hypothetical protein
MKCNVCGEQLKENGINCDWNQGRCPHRTPMLTEYHFRYLNLMNWIKSLFKGKDAKRN